MAKTDTPKTRRDTAAPSFIVGIGASAGGLHAIEAFLEKLPSETRLAFVIVQHLSPDFKSMMDELLSRKTRLPVQYASDATVVRPGNIYLLPPRKDMIISGGRLLVTDKDSREEFFLPIDHFFRSLGQDQERRSVGIVLSGTGGDGTRGIEEIHARGGLVLSQTLDSAAFDGMPRSAQATGLVDFVLPPEEMAGVLQRYEDGPDLWRKKLDTEAVSSPQSDHVGTILHLLNQKHGVDFSNYKPEMIGRRIDRRLLIRESLDLAAYAESVAGDPNELAALYRDLLIGVTGFFRDPLAFEEFRTRLLPELVARAESDGEFRAWVAAVATGEEAYSIAILLHEMFSGKTLGPNCRIFATDVHRASIEFASRGVYRAEQVRDVSPERLERYFTREGDQFQICDEIREMVVFAQHNVFTDAPFTNLDLVSCRNLFIYLKPEVQRRVLTLFHFGLKVRGGLWLGSSEAPVELMEEFDEVNSQWKMYTKRRDVRLTPRARMAVTAPRSLTVAGRPRSTELIHLIGVYDQLLAMFMPPAILVSEDQEMVQTFGGASRFIRLGDGRVSNNVLEQIHPELRSALTVSLRKAALDAGRVDFNGLKLDLGKGPQGINLTVAPLTHPTTAEVFYLIEFHVSEDSGGESRAAFELEEQAASTEYVKQLERELRLAEQRLDASVQQLQTTNEEMQSTNQELVASNEELQSANEELHSVNEELYTVNAEHQRKISELTQVTADMDNLFNSTRVATVFLDRSLRIRKFTPDVARIFNLIDGDIGRGLESFTNDLEIDDLMKEVRGVLVDGEMVQREVATRGGKLFLMRIVPYLVRGQNDGVVLSFVDVTDLKKVERQLAELSDIVRQSDDAIFRIDEEGIIRTWNAGAEHLYGYAEQEVLGRGFHQLVTEESRHGLETILAGLAGQRSAERIRMRHVTRAGNVIDVAVSVSTIRGASGKVAAASVIARDIGDQIRAENEILSAVTRRDRFLALLSHELRNPLGAIVNAARLSNEAGAGENGRQHAIDVILRQSQQMSRLLDDLLDVSRITLGKIELKREVFDFQQMVFESVESVRAGFEAARLNLELDLGGEPVYVEGDPVRLQQVVVNLLRNAMKYTPAAGHVALTVVHDQREVEVRVQDSGVGISPEMLPQVFEMFVQASNSIDRSQGGIGVGLTLVEAIVSMHGGSVEAASDGIGKGSEFRFRVPLTQRRPRAAEPADQRTIESIVVVEDIDDAREMLVELLALQGFQVDSAAEGHAGWSLIRQKRPDLALIDIGLPGIDGYQIAERLRSDPQTRSLFLVALTGYGQESDREKVLAAGFDDHLVKPLRPQDITRVLQR